MDLVSSLNKNLQYSTEACSYVIKTLAMGGANWDQYTGPGSWEDCIKDFSAKICAPKKDPVDICLYEKVRPEYKKKLASAKTMLEKMRIIAEEVKDKKCGNCGEFSALAFIYLYDKGVRPLDWMSLEGGDHAFVVIGQDKNRIAGKILSWGPDAVICDSWGQGFRKGDKRSGTYPATQFNSRMGGLVAFTGVNSLHREK